MDAKSIDRTFRTLVSAWTRHDLRSTDDLAATFEARCRLDEPQYPAAITRREMR